MWGCQLCVIVHLQQNFPGQVDIESRSHSQVILPPTFAVPEWQSVVQERTLGFAAQSRYRTCAPICKGATSEWLPL